MGSEATMCWHDFGRPHVVKAGERTRSPCPIPHSNSPIVYLPFIPNPSPKFWSQINALFPFLDLF